MDWLNILFTSGITSGLIALLVFLSKEWIAVRLKESIAAEYKQALEEYKSQLQWEEKRKQQAAEIAELFSLWMKHNYFPEESNNKIRYELQKKYWELVLWLDAPVLNAVHIAFKSSTNPGITHKQALIAVRKLYVDENDGIKADDLFHWNADSESP